MKILHKVSYQQEKSSLIINNCIYNIFPTDDGYYKFADEPYKLQKVHRVIMQLVLNRPIKKGEEVHHIDWNPKNNDPKNLILLDRNTHLNIHRRKIKNIIFLSSFLINYFNLKENQQGWNFLRKKGLQITYKNYIGICKFCRFRENEI